MINQHRHLYLFFIMSFLLLNLQFQCKSKQIKDSANESKKIKEKKPTVLDQIVYIVNDTSISRIEIDIYANLLRYQKQRGNLQRKAEALLIEKILVSQRAKESSIVVNQDRVEREIRSRQISSGLDAEEFRKRIERTGLSFAEWKSTVYYEILKVYFIQTGLNIRPPSEREIYKYYKNKGKEIGFEVSYREIILPVRRKGFKEELRISKIANNFYNMVKKNKNNFNRLAKKIRENIAGKKNYVSLPPYIPIFEIAQQDIILASTIDQTKEKGLSKPFRDKSNQYRVVLIEDKRTPSFSKMRDFIQRKIFFDKATRKFNQWIAKEKKAAYIKRL